MASHLPREPAQPPRQQTIARPVTLTGTGLHTGAPVGVRIRPAPERHGIVFLRDGVRIPALVEQIDSTPRCSALSSGSVQVFTVEHLLAAAAGLGVDNLLVEVDGPEIPALDGSSLLFARALLEAGIVSQEAPARQIILRELLWVSDGDRHVVAVPADGLTVAATVDYGREWARAQAYAYSFDRPPGPAFASLLPAAVGGAAEQLLAALNSPSGAGDEGQGEPAFVRELAPARTFCFEDWVPAIHAAGLGGGGSIENTLVFLESGPSTPLRFPNEPARHKTLDLLGDLTLLGGRLLACVVAIKAGHALHLEMAEQIRRQTDAEG